MRNEIRGIRAQNTGGSQQCCAIDYIRDALIDCVLWLMMVHSLISSHSNNIRNLMFSEQMYGLCKNL